MKKLLIVLWFIVAAVYVWILIGMLSLIVTMQDVNVYVGLVFVILWLIHYAIGKEYLGINIE